MLHCYGSTSARTYLSCVCWWWCMQKLTNNTKADLPGGYTLADGSKLAVYGPQQWFTPCAWNDWTCAVRHPARRATLQFSQGTDAHQSTLGKNMKDPVIPAQQASTDHAASVCFNLQKTSGYHYDCDRHRQPLLSGPTSMCCSDCRCPVN